MDQQPLHSAYEFGDFRVERQGRVLRLKDGGRALPLSARAFDILLRFLQQPGELLDKSALMAAAWPTVVVDENNLNQQISALRRALGDRPEDHRFILTEPGRGYRFVAAVRQLDLAQAAEPAAPEEPQRAAETASRTQDPGSVPAGTVAPERIEEAHRARLPLFAAPRSAARVWRWGGGLLIAAALLALPWAIHQRSAQRQAAQTGPAAPVIHSLVVLPLANLSGDRDQDYFADGMTDALITALAQVESLRVISRTSAMQFKGSRETLPQIGRDLKVDAVVEGAVTRSENRLRVTAQLVEASSDHHLWAKAYERDLKDVLVLQDEIARDIAEQVRVSLTPKGRPAPAKHAVDPQAYDAYLRGAYWMNQLTREGFQKGCTYMQQAVARDPDYALAYVGVSQCASVRSADEAKAAVVKALALDPSLAEAHSQLAELQFTGDWDWGAEGEYRKAIALGPNSGPAHCSYSQYLVAMGRLDEARTVIERAQDLDPYSIFPTEWLGQVLYHARQYDDALREMRRGLEMHPGTSGFYWAMADVYEQKKMYAEAFAARQQALRSRDDPRVSVLAAAYQRAGYPGYLLKQAEFEQAHNLAYAAHLYALLGDQPRALDALESAYNQRLFGILFIRTAPEFDAMRSSPRFQDLVRRIGFPASAR